MDCFGDWIIVSKRKIFKYGIAKVYMTKVIIERQSEKHYTIKGKSIFGNEVIEYICSGYLNQEELYQKIERKEATELSIVCRLNRFEFQEEMHKRLRETVFQRASMLMANIPLDQMIDVDFREPRKMLEATKSN